MTDMAIKLNNYNKELVAINEERQKLPKGRLVKKANRYYHAIDRKEIGITKNPELIRLLCRQKYLLAREKQLNNNIPIISRNISKLDHSTVQELILSLPSAYQNLPNPYFFNQRTVAWQEEPYRQNSYLPESLNYFSKKGTPLRSKSEVLIANILEENDLPYRYDAEMTSSGKKISPDFIIKNPFNGKTIIWEHFGALNEPNYAKKMNDKMKLYLNNGYSPFETIIYTFEFDIMVTDNKRIKDLVENIIKLD